MTKDKVIIDGHKTIFFFFCFDTTRASNISSHFRKNLLVWIQKLIITIYDKIRDDKIWFDINIEVAKISALSSGKADKYEHLTGEEILSSDQSRIIEEVKFIYSPFGKTFEKQIKTLEYQGRKQVQASEIFKPEQKIQDMRLI